jgi:hypothetical protein
VLASACQRAVGADNLPFVFQYCPSEIAGICSRAAVSNNLDVIGSYCPQQARPLAMQYCAGKDFSTAMKDPVWGNFCGRSMRLLGMANRPANTATAMPGSAVPIPVSAAPMGQTEQSMRDAASQAATQGVADGVRQGVNSLFKGLFGQ